MAGRFRVRPGTPADAPAAADAEQRCFSDPWSAASITELFGNETVFSLIAEQAGPKKRLAGYLFARAIAGEAEIMNLAVLPEYRRSGIGRQLVEGALGELRGRKVAAVFLEVRESNLAARSLYEGFGFRAIGFRADYYRSPRENALVLRHDLETVLI